MARAAPALHERRLRGDNHAVSFMRGNAMEGALKRREMSSGGEREPIRVVRHVGCIRRWLVCALPAVAALVTLLDCSSSGSGSGDSPVVAAPNNEDGGNARSVDGGGGTSGDLDAAPGSTCIPIPFPEAGVAVGGQPPEDCAGHVYCEDFETYDAGPLKRFEKVGPWQANGGAIDAIRAYTGHQALHTGSLSQAVPDGIGNHVFGRAMFYFVETPDGGGLPERSHSAFFRATGDYTGPDGGSVILDLAVGGKTGTDMWFNYFPPHHFEVTSSGAKYTTNTWHCLQWELDGTGSPPNQGRIWLDEQLIIDQPASKGWLWATPWKNFEFGFMDFTGGGGPFDVWLDTFALDDKMIACPPPAACSR
jgi:hypothetical protein